ncbi:MAG: nuclear transport factor 2 family protein [Gemmatimonadetes bacterium]|nr:nuclear transport factor 2 family protein [Gemmatimonadota bacterium]
MPPRPPADGRTDLTVDENIPEHPGADSIYPRFSRAYATLDVDLLADLYAEDAVYVTPDGVLKRGRAEIRAGFAQFFGRTSRNAERMEIRFRVLTRRVTGDTVTDVGLFTLDRFRGEEQLARDVGKFVTVASPGPDGTWRFDLDSYSMVNQGDPE